MVGFAAETEKVIEHAQAKLARKGCDWIVANDVSAGDRRHGRRQQHRASRLGGRRRILADHEQGRGRATRWRERIAAGLKDKQMGVTIGVWSGCPMRRACPCRV